MKSAFYALGIFAIGFALGRFTAQPTSDAGLRSDVTIDRIGVRQAAPMPAEPVAAENDFTRIYAKLGLQNGDTIFDVNGTPVPQGFTILAAAYQAGNVCVRYERGGVDRRVCLKRDETGQRFTDTPIER